MNRWKQLPFSGGLLDQPDMLMAELGAVDLGKETADRLARAFSATGQQVGEANPQARAIENMLRAMQ